MPKFRVGDWVRKKSPNMRDKQAYRIEEIIDSGFFSSWLRSTSGSDKISYRDKACVRTCPLEATLLTFEILRK